MTLPVWTLGAGDAPDWIAPVAEGSHPELDDRRALLPVLRVPAEAAAAWEAGRDHSVEPAEGDARWYEAAPATWRELILEGALVALRGPDGWAGVWEIDTSHMNATRFFLRTGAQVAEVAEVAEAADVAATDDARESGEAGDAARTGEPGEPGQTGTTTDAAGGSVPERE